MAAQHHAQPAARELEEMRRQAMEFAGIGLWRCTLDGTIAYMDERALQILGLERTGATPASVIGESVENLMPRFESLAEILGSIRAKRTIRNLECEFELTAGITRWTLCDFLLYQDEGSGQDTVQVVMHDITDRVRARNRMHGLNATLLSFGPNPDQNIDLLTEFIGKALDGTCALYNRLDRGLLCSIGRWETPPDYDPVDKPDGHICFDVIERGGDDVFLVRNLPHSRYARTDPNVKRYGLQTYIGIGIRLGGRRVGSLCVVYQRDYEPSREDEQLLHVVASAIEIEEERKREKKALFEGEEKYRAVVEQAMENIFLLNPESGQIIEANAALHKLLGYTSEEMKALTVFDFVAHSREDVKQKMELIQREKQVYVGERRYRCKNGSLVDVEVGASLVHFAEKNAISVVSRDLTERKQARDALMKSEEKFRTLAEQSPNMIFINSRGRIVYANRRCEEIMGYKREEFYTEGFDYLSLIAPESRELIRENLARHSAEEELEPYEYVLVTREGKRVDALITTKLIDHGDTKAIFGIVTDITALKGAEEALRASEKKFRTLTENINVGIYRTTAGSTGRFLEANPAMISMFGYADREELLAQDVSDLYRDPIDRARFNEKILKEGHVREEELHLRRKDGSTFLGSVSAVAVYDAKEDIAYFDGIVEDITERKRTEEALRWSEHQYRTTIESMGDAIHVVDRDLRVVLFNKAFHTWNSELGLSTDVMNRPLATIFPFLNDGVFKEYQQVFETGEPIISEEATAVSGRPFVTEVRKIPVLEGDEVVRIVTSVRDITTRKRAEAALRESEERYRALFDNATDLVFAMDLRGTFTNVNRAAKHHTGRASEELVGIGFREYVAVGDIRRVIQAFRRVYETGQAMQDFPVDVIVADGARKQFEVSVGLLRKGDEIIGFQGSGRDVTERKRANEALLRSEERFRELAELLPEIVFEMDTGGLLTFVNRKAFEITGYGVEDLERGFTAVDLLAPDDRDRARKNITNSMRGVHSGDNEYVAQRKDGSTFPIMARSVPMINDGEVVGLRGILIDMTERERLEEQLRHAAKMEAVGQLAGGIAHDFNNLLTGILGYANMLKLNSEPASDVYDAAKIIEGAAERAAELTEKLLGFARRGKLQVLPVDLHKTIYDVVSLLSRTISKTIRMSVQLGARTATVMGDPGQLQQVLLNLAINARDAMPQGGDLVFSTRRVELDEEYCRTHVEGRPGDYLLIEISDTGCGMPNEIVGRIYEPFFTTKPTGEGTGMGLAMVYGIVKNHGGEIAVESEVDRGTVFRVFLPAVHEQPMAPAQEISGQEIGGTGSILVVDDEVIVRKAAADMLSRLGYDVTAVSSATEAVQYYREHASSTDLVIIDLVMPDMDGRECFQNMRAINPRIRALLSTGYGLDGKAEEILEEGMLGFIQKPYQLKELDIRVREALAVINRTGDQE